MAKKTASKTKAKPADQPHVGQGIENEIGRLVGDFPLHYFTSSRSCHVTIDLEHNGEVFDMIGVYDCRGNVAKQLVAECERVAGEFHKLARIVKEQAFKDYLEMCVQGKGGAA